MSLKENSCKNFVPNVFNKNKCLNCFKSRDTHLKSDKDLSKAKAIYGGWLLLAPIGTDFGNPAQKNRKWQRRWFVLFEHGALRYSLDNSETTVAQGTIDMNKCNDVTYAESITDQKHSLCIYLPDQRYYIRGECREDIMNWHDQLVVYPETNKEERKRLNRLNRNRQYGVTPPAEDVSKNPLSSPLLLRSRNSSSSSVRSPSSDKTDLLSPRNLSKKSDLIIPKHDKQSARQDLNAIGSKKPDVDPVQPAFGRLDTSYFTNEKKQDPIKEKSDPTPSSGGLQRHVSISTSSLDSTTSNQSMADSTDSSLLGNSRKKHLKDHQNTSELAKSKRQTSSQHRETRRDLDKKNKARSPVRDDLYRDRKRSTLNNVDSPQADTSNKENDEPSLALSDSTHVDHGSSSTHAVTSPVTSPLATPRDSDREDKRGRTIARRSTNNKQGTQTDLQPRSAAELRRAKSLDRSAYENITLTSDLFNSKKGWLQIQDQKSHWNKHWFVLGKGVLNFYEFSSAEDSSNPTGSLDLSKFVEVKESDVQRNYGFQVKTATDTHIFSAMTPGIRRNWINALNKACTALDVDPEPAQTEKPAVEKSEEEKEPTTPTHDPDSSDLSVSERSARRRARIRERRKGGRSRTFDFGEIRPLTTPQTFALDLQQSSKPDKKSDVKARSRTFDHDTLLKDTGKFKKSVDDIDGDKNKTDFNKSFSPPARKSSAEIQASIDGAWKKVDQAVGIEIPLSPSPITKTASMVKALQSEVDSLKKQMERAHTEKSLSSDEFADTDGSLQDSFTFPDVSNTNNGETKDKLQQQTSIIDKLKQELSITQDALRKQSAELRDFEMQREISRSESQVFDSRLTNLQNELLLEKSRREEAEKENIRTTAALNKELEDSEAKLKKSESMHLDAQSKIRELERSIHIHKNRDKEDEFLQGHIGVLRGQVVDQEKEMREMQESFEEKCQHQKKLEDRLSEAKELIHTYEEQMHEMRESLKNTDKNVSLISAKSNNDQAEMRRLTEQLVVYRTNENKLKERIEKLVAQSELDEDCNKSLQEKLAEEKSTNQRLRDLMKEHDNKTSAANEKKVNNDVSQIQQLSERLKMFEDENQSLQTKYKELQTEYEKSKDEIASLSQSEQVICDLRARLSLAEKKLGDIEAIRSRSSSSSESSFRTKLSELEAELGGTGQMIAARLQSLGPSRRVSDPSLPVIEKESSTQKIHRLESELENKLKDLNSCEDKLKELEEKYKEAENSYSVKLNELKESRVSASKDHEEKVNSVEANWKAAEDRLSAQQYCLSVLHRRVSRLSSADDSETTTLHLQQVISDLLQLSEGNTQMSESPPRSPSPTSDLSDRRWSRVTNEESRQQHQRAMTRLRQLTEQLKSADGRLVSPVGSTSILSNVPKSPSANLRPKDLQISSQKTPLTDDASAQLFAKQIGAQALLLAEMAVTLRRSQSAPGLVNRSTATRQGSPSPQLCAADFSDNNAALAGVIGGGLLEHVDTLAQKLTLEGLLMREISRLKETWLLKRNRAGSHPTLTSTTQPSSDLSSAMVAHAQISYVLQVYNERISRLSLEAKQARHRADAAMRKLRELVQACKAKDLDTISNLAVQVDLDTIASPYSDKPQWEQQVDYGTLHGAHSAPTSSSDLVHLDQEAIFFQHLADDLKCMSADVESLSKLGSQLVQNDAALQKCLLPSEIGEHASTVAREAIVQAEIIYISHRLRRDYDEELRKAKDAVSSQSNHIETLKSKMKQSDESWAAKLKLAAEDNNANVTRLIQEMEKLSNDTNERFTQLSKKNEQELKSCEARHEQEKLSLKKDLALAKSDLEASTKDYMSEVKSLKEKLEKIEVQHRKEIDEAHARYNTEINQLRKSCDKEVKSSRKKHEKEIDNLKAESEKEFTEMSKEFADKLSSIEETKTKEIIQLKKENQNLEKLNKKALEEVERDWLSKFETVKREFDEFLKQEKLKHQMAIKNVQDDAEEEAQMKYKQKLNNVKKEHEKLLERRDDLHKEQLEREKEVWMKECRLQWEAEREVAHSRSSSMTSEAESKDSLKVRISDLEEQLNSMQGKLEDEQHRHNYQSQLNEIKTLCDKSFTSIEESHAKQLEDLQASHKREMDRLVEEHSSELDTNREDTRRVVEAMRKHHLDELRALRQEVRSGLDQNEPADVSRLNQEIETLSEHLTRKCVELEEALDVVEKNEDKIKSLEREIQLLQSRRTPSIGDSSNERESNRLSTLIDDDQNATDLYQLQVKLRVKVSEIDYLKQDVTSLNKQIDEAYQEIKQLQRKHKSLFEELTISRSKEGMARREVSRFKDLMRRRGVYPDDDLDSDDGPDSRDGSPRGYDFQKSRSQPDFPSTVLKPSLSLASQQQSTTSSSASVKRRSSERSSRHGKV